MTASSLWRTSTTPFGVGGSRSADRADRITYRRRDCLRPQADGSRQCRLGPRRFDPGEVRDRPRLTGQSAQRAAFLGAGRNYRNAEKFLMTRNAGTNLASGVR